MPDTHMTFDHDGAERHPGAAHAVLGPLLDALAGVPPDLAGARIAGIPALAALLDAAAPVGALAGSVLGPDCIPVRAVLFDKTSDTNWSLGWHQDRVIIVDERRNVPGFGPWTVKQGLLHVAPPFAVLASMVTLRIHLDDVSIDNAPLLVAPGSHRLGRVPVDQVDAAVEACGTRACLAAAGDVWLYATPILHASAVAVRPTRRRVLQVDYAACPLPDGLRWRGI